MSLTHWQKGERGEAFFRESFAPSRGILVPRQTKDRDDDFNNSDLPYAHGGIEIKCQDICPWSYQQLNVVEFMKWTPEQTTYGGNYEQATARILIPLEQMKELIGYHPYVADSLRPLNKANFIGYISDPKGLKRGWLYMYRKEEILRLVREEILAGRAILRDHRYKVEGVMQVRIPLPAEIWEYQGGLWRYIGTGSEQQILNDLWFETRWSKSEAEEAALVASL